ncbi:MAG TPA: ribonuclease HII [Alphaproteobacteria bacterium]|nr:ribonuclease HII [Alphaproteobacteria bacterium]
MNGAIGIDEAGRGPLAGPVVAAAVVLPQDFELFLRDQPPLTDSKKLSSRQREVLYEIISREARYGIGIVGVKEIAELNILGATMLAMQRAVAELAMHIRRNDNGDLHDWEIWVDGNRAPEFPSFHPQKILCFVGGDATHMPISAASILAKVTRDKIMMEMHQRYPMYGFNKHMGYGTAAHRAAILQYGACPEHRELFLRKIIAA